MDRPSVRIILLGTGTAFNTDGRGSQCLRFEPRGRAPFLVDAGPTALAAMERFRVGPEDLDTVFLTHLHGDHTAGWPFLVLHATYIARRTRQLRVIGPEGTRKQLEMLVLGSYPDLFAKGKVPFPIEHLEIPVRRGSHEADGILFDVVPLEHHESSIGYRFRLPGATIAVSGDTRWCGGLEELASGCDLLLLECTSLRKTEVAHVSLEELREGIGRLGARKVLLVHLPDEVSSSLEAEPLEGVSAGEDGLAVTVG